MTPPRRDAAEQARVDAALVEIFEQRMVGQQGGTGPAHGPGA